MNKRKLLYGYCCGKMPWIFKMVPDELYLKMVYNIKTGKRLDLKNPKEYNEKLQWLKLHNRKPEYTILVDKYRVRNVIKSMIGEEYLIPLLGVWERPSEIEFSKLPSQFVLKCKRCMTVTFT